MELYILTEAQFDSRDVIDSYHVTLRQFFV